jgi:hypothetical protein
MGAWGGGGGGGDCELLVGLQQKGNCTRTLFENLTENTLNSVSNDLLPILIRVRQSKEFNYILSLGKAVIVLHC